MRTPAGHIIISGTGRAGTTLLVQYFTAAGFDTGFNLEEAVAGPAGFLSFAGLERHLTESDLPHIVKSPWFADEIEQVLSERRLSIETAIIPMRDLFSAAESRRRVYREAKAINSDPLAYPGSIWKTDKPEEQETWLAIQFYKLVEPLVRAGIPIVFLPFPAFAKSHDVLYAALRPILDRYRVSRRASASAYDAVVKPNLIHDFSSRMAEESSR